MYVHRWRYGMDHRTAKKGHLGVRRRGFSKYDVHRPAKSFLLATRPGGNEKTPTPPYPTYVPLPTLTVLPTVSRGYGGWPQAVSVTHSAPFSGSKTVVLLIQADPIAHSLSSAAPSSVSVCKLPFSTEEMASPIWASFSSPGTLVRPNTSPSSLISPSK